MNMRVAVVAAIAAASFVGAAALAQPMMGGPVFEPPEPTTNPATTADDAARGDPNKIICRNVRPPTGTRVRSARTRQKVCMSKAQWEQEEAEARENARNMNPGVCGGMDKGSSGGSCSGADR